MNSMLEKLSYHWGLMQENLFPVLRAKEEMSEMTRMHQRLIGVLEFVRVENFIRHFDRHVGRPVNDRCAIARAFIAKNLYNIGETKTFIEFITNDAILRRLCGWDSKRDIPSESTFSRAFAEFAKAELSSRMLESFIKEYHGTRLVGEISRDSTAIEAREKSVFKPKKKKPDQSNRKRGRPKKGTPRVEKEKTRGNCKIIGRN